MTTTVSLTVLIFALEMPLIELDLGANVARPSVTPPDDLKLMDKNEARFASCIKDCKGYICSMRLIGVLAKYDF